MARESKMPNSAIEIWGYNGRALTCASGNCTTQESSEALWKALGICPTGLFTQTIPSSCHADCWSFSFVMFSNSLQIVSKGNQTREQQSPPTDYSSVYTGHFSQHMHAVS